MYVQYWNLECRPFECDYNPRFFFRSRSHQAALLKLRYLIDSNKGAGLLIGESGAGKSCLTSFLASGLDDRYSPVITLHYPLLNSRELIAFLAAELGAGEDEVHPENASLDQLLRNVKTRLSGFRDDGKHPIVILDDAHLIEDQSVFQTLQLLLNLRHEAPFTVILTGQPALLTRVAQVPALDQRMGVKSLLQPLTREETARYIEHRLTIAGLQASGIFTPDAIDEIHELSGGLPRQINRLADLALLVGYADELPQLTAPSVSSVAEEIGISVGFNG